MLNGKYENGTTKLIKKVIQPGMVVVDIGSHIGYFSRLFSKLVGGNGKVIGFEPEPDNFSILQKNISKLTNIEIYNNAVSNTETDLEFYKVSNSTGCHSIIKPDSSHHSIKVKSVTLDAFLSSQGIQKVDLIKMDIEGAEYLALQGMEQIIQNNNLKIILEISPRSLKLAGIDLNQIHKILAGFNFSIREILDNGKLGEKLESFDLIDFFVGTGEKNFYLEKNEA